MFTISNVYGHGFAGPEVEAIERAGFTMRSVVSRYPGSQVCRFIDFEDGPSLEFVEVEDDKAYLDFVPNGMKPYAPGISVAIEEFAERDLGDFERKFADLAPYRLHWNYDGTETPGKPGWSYLNFSRPILRDTFLWLTQLDLPRPPRRVPAEHPNGVVGVRALVFDLEEAEFDRLARLLKDEPRRNGLEIDRVEILRADVLPDRPPRRGKAFPLVAIILETDDLGDLPRSAREGHEATFRSRPAVEIRTNDLSWDLVVTERDRRVAERAPLPTRRFLEAPRRRAGPRP